VATRQRHPAMPNATRSSGWPRRWASSSSRRSASCRLRWTPPEVTRAPVARARVFVSWAGTRPGVLLTRAVPSKRVQTADGLHGSDARVMAVLCAGESDALRADLHGWTQFAEQAGGAGVGGRGKRAACVRKQARTSARCVPADAHSGSPVRRRPWSGVFLGRCE